MESIVEDLEEPADIQVEKPLEKEVRNHYGFTESEWDALSPVMKTPGTKQVAGHKKID